MTVRCNIRSKKSKVQDAVVRQESARREDKEKTTATSAHREGQHIQSTHTKAAMTQKDSEAHRDYARVGFETLPIFEPGIGRPSREYNLSCSGATVAGKKAILVIHSTLELK
jgi:hypothetical protein